MAFSSLGIVFFRSGCYIHCDWLVRCYAKQKTRNIVNIGESCVLVNLSPPPPPPARRHVTSRDFTALVISLLFEVVIFTLLRIPGLTDLTRRRLTKPGPTRNILVYIPQFTLCLLSNVRSRATVCGVSGDSSQSPRSMLVGLLCPCKQQLHRHTKYANEVPPGGIVLILNVLLRHCP